MFFLQIAGNRMQTGITIALDYKAISISFYNRRNQGGREGKASLGVEGGLWLHCFPRS